MFDFTRDLPAGNQCTFSVGPDFKTLAGSTISGKSKFGFSTGGPAAIRVQPYPGSNIEEEQAFILIQNGASSEASILQHVYCEIEGVHERVPVKFLSPDERNALLKHYAADMDAARVTTIQCQQRFPNHAAVKLVWGKGIATISGAVNSKTRSYAFKTRPVFTASMSCERENPDAACTPLAPVALSFSSPISRKFAEGIILKSKNNNIKADFNRQKKNAWFSYLRFKAPMAEETEYSLALPGFPMTRHVWATRRHHHPPQYLSFTPTAGVGGVLLKIQKITIAIT